MATLSEHAEAIKAAIQAARDDGYLIEFEFEYANGYDGLDVEAVTMNFYRNKRGKDGIMRREEQSTILSEYV